MMSEGTLSPEQKTSRFRDELEAAMEAAFRAGALIRRFAGSLGEDDIREKGTHDLVTEVDLASEALIVDHLRTAFPDHAFLAEESHVPSAAIASRSSRWVIDPIDGTTNFAHGVPPYAVSIALELEGVLSVAVVLEVVSGELFTACQGEGLYVDGKRSGVSTTDQLGHALITTGFPYRSFDHLETYLTVLKTFMTRSRGVRRHGSASIDMAYLASGRFDGFFETGLAPWDVAAGTLLVREAGGEVTTFGGQGHPVYDGQILGSNGVLHEQMRDVVSPLRSIFA
jgi:myo-inositol-1(or 4)-monophosphatase